MKPLIRLLPRAASLPFARLLLAAALAASFVPTAFGGPPAPPNFPGSIAPSAANGDLARRIAAILDGPDLRHASVGVLVQSLQGPNGKRLGRVLFERNADLVLVPASNQKILTAAVALRHLGPDFRFETRIGYVGTLGPGEGTLSGDVVLTGTGDPSLNTAKLAELARALKSAGVRRLAGRIVTDDLRFDDRRLGVGWQWNNEPRDYQPQVSALNLDGNVVRLSVAPSERTGDVPVATLDPPTSYVRVANTARTVAASRAAGGNTEPTKAAIVFDRRRGQNELLVSGTISVGAKPAAGVLTVEEPSLFAAARLAELLRAEGITVPDDTAPVRATAPILGAVPVSVVTSEPLPGLLRTFLKQSDNLYGETLLKAVGAATSGQGTTGAGARAIAALLAEASGEVRALDVADGSGLSRLNLVSPRNLVALLTHVNGNATAPTSIVFRAALPVGGVDGTLRTRFRNTPAQGVVRAKTGSLAGVSALSGYVTTRAGEPLAFSILMNNYRCPASAARRAQDDIVLALMDVPRPSTAAAGAVMSAESDAARARTPRSGASRSRGPHRAPRPAATGRGQARP